MASRQSRAALPLRITASNTSGLGNAIERANDNGRSPVLTGDVRARLNRYFDTSVFSQPAAFTLAARGSSSCSPARAGRQARRLSGRDLSKVSRGIVCLDGRAALAVSESAMALENSARIRK